MVQRIVKRDLNGRVYEAADAFDALEYLEKDTFEVVIVSLDLRAMSGTRLLELMRKVPQTAKLPVIMLSSRSDEATIRNLAQLGVAGVLAKPIDPALLSRRLQRFGASSDNSPFHAYNNDASHATETVLVVDGDANFRHFAADALRGGRRILQVNSGAAAVKSALVHRPGLAIVGQGIGLLDGSLFASEIRSIPSLSSMRIVKLSSDAAEAAPPGFDGVVPRTFVPDVFRRAVGLVSGPQGPLTKFISMYPGLLRDITTGVEQVCGMMLGLEMRVEEAATPVTGAAVRSAQVVTAADRGLSLRFEVEGALAVATAMTSELAGIPEADVTQEDACATMAEIANIVTGRLRNALGEAGIILNCSLPSTRVADTGLTFEPQEQSRYLHYVSADGAIRLHVAVEASYRAEDLISVA